MTKREDSSGNTGTLGFKPISCFLAPELMLCALNQAISLRPVMHLGIQ